MKTRAFGHTDVGRVREHNEDALLIDEALGCYILSDGVGGAAAGEVASRMTCDVIHQRLKDAQRLLAHCAEHPTAANRDKVVGVIKRAIQTACAQVYKASQANAAQRGMASTAAVMVIVGHRAVIAHVGDSRVYLCRDGKVHQLTEDHTVAADQFRRGEISREQSEVIATASTLTRAVGFQASTEVDTLQVELASGDRFMLCSDGLYSYLPPADLELACEKLTAERMGPALVDTANKRGGGDNISLVVVDIVQARAMTPVSPQEKIAAIKAIALFKHLTDKEIHAVLSACEVTAYPPGERIITEGEPGQKLFISVSGTVEVVKQGQAIATLPGGSSFGEMALIDQAPRSADVVARDKVQALSVSRDAFFSLLKAEPALSVKLLWALCAAFNERLRETSAELSWLKQTTSPPLPTDGL